MIYSFQWGKRKLPTLEEIANRTRSQIRKLNGSGVAVEIKEPPMIWESDHRQHWPPDGTFFSRSGWYDRLQKVYSSPSDKVHVPYNVPNSSFSRFFGEEGKEEFWAYRSADQKRDFGFFVEHVPRTWPYGSWAGGSLQIFWSRKTGILLLSTHDKTGDEFHKKENTRVYSVIDQWATDHVWGRKGDHVFTTATAFNLSPTKVTADPVESNVVTVSRFRNDQGDLYGDTTLTSTFTALENGLKVTKSLSGTIESSELWATIPVYLRDSMKQTDLKDTKIEAKVKGEWLLLAGMQSTNLIRLTRDTPEGPAFAYIRFDKPQKVRAAEVWQAGYQSRARVQNLQVELQGKKSLEWTITVED